jgi:transposase
MTLYVEEITRVGQIPTKVWCVSDIKAPVRFCYSQDTSRGWVQRYDPTGEAWKTVSARLNP